MKYGKFRNSAIVFYVTVECPNCGMISTLSGDVPEPNQTEMECECECNNEIFLVKLERQV